MNGINKITAKLAAEAQAEIDQIEAEAAAKCGEIRAEYEKKAAVTYKKRIASGEKACEDRAQRLGSAAEMEAKKSILAFKQEMVSKAFERAVASIAEMPKEKYVAFLASQAAKAAGDGDGELIFNAKDRDALGQDVVKAAAEKGAKGKLTVSKQTRDIPGGLVVRQGNIELNCAVDTLVSLYRNELAAQVAEILFA